MIKRINKIITATVLLGVAIAPMSYVANAGIMDWITAWTIVDEADSELGDELFLSDESKFAAKVKEQKSNYVLDVIQNNSVVQSNNPFGFNFLQKSPADVLFEINEKVAKEMTVPATAYSSTPDQTDDSPFITAMGTYVRDGLVAANFLPFGTRIKIPDIYGDKIFIVEDRMNKRYWHKVDIWFPDRESAMQFGLRTIRIQILES